MWYCTSGLENLQDPGSLSDVKHRATKPLQAGDQEQGKTDSGLPCERSDTEKNGDRMKLGLQ